MSAASRIDVQQNDRGLQTCFEAANVSPAWAATFCKQHNVETLDDFVYLMDTKEWEPSLKALLQEAADLKDNRIILTLCCQSSPSRLSARTSSNGMGWSLTPIWTLAMLFEAVFTGSFAGRPCLCSRLAESNR